MSSDPHLRRALEALRAAARDRLLHHPQGHLLLASRNELELSLPVLLGPGAGSGDGGEISDDNVAEARTILFDELDAAIARRSAFRSGRVLCLRCSSADCEHSAPSSPREVFAGYSASGLPYFLDFGQWLLERKHPEIDRLFRQPPQLVTDVASGRELEADLLDAYRDRRNDYRIHGQVTAGWFPIRSGETLALTFQVLSSAIRKGRRKGQRHLGLNVLGIGPRQAGGESESLEDLYSRLGAIPWSSVVQWSQSVLQSIERSQSRKKTTPEHLARRIEGVLNSIARRLQQEHRSRGRRTRHAQERHTAGDRPTRMALRDLSHAQDESFLFDTRRKTVIVLGDRGRAHVWSTEGKLVTSIRYSPDSIARKKKRHIWRPARPEEIVGLRKTLGVEQERDASGRR